MILLLSTFLTEISNSVDNLNAKFVAPWKGSVTVTLNIPNSIVQSNNTHDKNVD